MNKQRVSQTAALGLNKDQAHTKGTVRLVLFCFLYFYIILVVLLCGYAADQRKTDVCIESDSTGERIPPPTLQGDIDLNTADLETLCLLPGIGEKLSQAILDYRQEYGHFDFPEDILYVHGIGEKRLENIIPFITLSEAP